MFGEGINPAGRTACVSSGEGWPVSEDRKRRKERERERERERETFLFMISFPSTPLRCTGLSFFVSSVHFLPLPLVTLAAPGALMPDKMLEMLETLGDSRKERPRPTGTRF